MITTAATDMKPCLKMLAQAFFQYKRLISYLIIPTCLIR